MSHKLRGECVPRKQKSFDPITQCSALRAVYISRASAKQRLGRAGRVRPGMCFRLFSKQRFDAMALFQVRCSHCYAVA